MKITVEPTEEFFMAGDVMVRMWKGVAKHGDGRTEPCFALVSLVGFSGQVAVEGLVSVPAPTGDDARRWAAEVLSKRYEGDRE
jgi:hypothetical protein